MKWKDYSTFECTWEPASHLPHWMVREYKEPKNTLERIQVEEVSDTLLVNIQQRLHRRTGPHFYINIRHDVFRCLMPQRENCLYFKSDFDQFIFPNGWDVVLYSKQGEGRKINFPMYIKPIVRWTKKQYEMKAGVVVQCNRCPVEYLKVEFSTERHVVEL